jgi:SAM-dependent methyltransferase
VAPRASTEAHWNRFWTERADIDAVYPTDGRVVAMIEEQGPVAGKRVMEVGAGSGRDSVRLAAAGATVVILDYSTPSLETARRVAAREGVRAHFVRADGLRLPFRDGTFDVVFHQGLLEHFRDPRPLLRENVRVLADDAILLVDVPQRFHLYTVGKHLLILLGRWFAGWETEFTIGELERLMRGAGVTIVRRYGAWMIPGLFYRALRLALLKARIARLPLYPRPWPVVTPILDALRRAWERTPMAFYTYFVIGAVGKKGAAPPRPAA